MMLQSSSPQANSTFIEPFARVSGILVVVEWAKVLRGFAPAAKGVGAHIAGITTFEGHRCVFYIVVHEINERVVNSRYSLLGQREFTEAGNATSTSSHRGNGTTLSFREPYQNGPPLVYQPVLSVNASSHGKKFTMSQDTFDMLSSQFTKDSNFLQGQVNVTESSSLSGPTTVFTLFQADNVTKAMYNIADYMTKSFRANNSLILQAAHANRDLIAPDIAPDQTINGKALTLQQIVRVQWVWLILPVLVLLLVTAFLCIAIAASRAHGIGARKDSPLTLFFHDASSDRDGGDGMGSLDTADAMKKAASRLKARIIKQETSLIEIT